MKKLFVIAAMIAAFGLGGAAAFAATADKPPSPLVRASASMGTIRSRARTIRSPTTARTATSTATRVV